MSETPDTPTVNRDFTSDEFYVDVMPRTLRGGDDLQPTQRTVYDIYLRSRANDNLLLFSNQGYENRAFAVDLATRIFAGKKMVLTVFDANEDMVSRIDLL